jgi:hypothetical protein
MRIHRGLLFVATIAFSGSGCLGSIIPDHAGGDDLGVAGSGGNGGSGGDTQLPSSGTGGNALDVDGGAGSGTGTGGGMAKDPNCINTATPSLDGHHNAGTACLACHDGNTAPKFTAGGTVYDKLTGGKGIAGVTVELIDAKGTKVSVVSASQGAAGNFYTTAALVFPVTVRATQCPADRPMITKLAGPTDGDCARSGCHGSTMLIHVP